MSLDQSCFLEIFFNDYLTMFLISDILRIFYVFFPFHLITHGQKFGHVLQFSNMYNYIFSKIFPYVRPQEPEGLGTAWVHSKQISNYLAIILSHKDPVGVLT